MRVWVSHYAIRQDGADIEAWAGVDSVETTRHYDDALARIESDSEDSAIAAHEYVEAAGVSVAAYEYATNTSIIGSIAHEMPIHAAIIIINGQEHLICEQTQAGYQQAIVAAAAAGAVIRPIKEWRQPCHSPYPSV